ncbi:MAG: GNAT family N-acetyltransferase [Candidatus Nanoarchaeia archaeon]|jgi:ribosomal protein S18 acetylase RimI-like enzyme
MSILFKKYEESDFNNFVKCMEGLQDYIIGLDSLRILRKSENYGKAYTQNIIKKISKHEGIIILAYEQKKIVGCIAGIIEKQTKDDLLECIPMKDGRVLELFVSNEIRNKGIGKKLMKKVEDYFKRKKCDAIRIEVFEPNLLARKFYEKIGYAERIIDLIKKL